MTETLPAKTESFIPPTRVVYAIRNQFNPLRDFTPKKLVQQIELFHTGYIKDAARTWDAMEKRDLMLGNVSAKRKKAVARLPWDVVTLDDSEAAKAQAEYLKAFYNRIEATSALDQDERGGVSLLARQMMDSVGKRYAVHEIVWKTDAMHGAENGLGAEFIFCPLWWFENRTGKLRFLPDEAAIDGTEMKSAEWLVTVGEGIMEGCSVAYVFKHMPLKDWLAYSEKFGMPGVIGKSSAAPGSEQWDAMEAAVRAFGQDWAAVTSQGDTIELVEVKGGQNLPFPPLVEYCDRMMASRWRGADLSTISQGNAGVGASLQGDESDLILSDDAGLISETLNARVDPLVIRYAFGPQAPVLAYFKLIASDESSADKEFKRKVWLQFAMDGTVGDVLANQTDLKELTGEVGLPVNEEYIDPYVPVTGDNGQAVIGELIRDSEQDVIGAKTEAPAEPMGMGRFGSLGGGAGFGAKTDSGLDVLPNERRERGALAGTNRIVSGARAAFAQATQATFKPIATRLQAALALTDASQQRIALQQLLRDFPALAEEIKANPKNMLPLADAMREAAEEGKKKAKS